MVLRSSQGTNLKIPLETHTHSLEKLSNQAYFLMPLLCSVRINVQIIYWATILSSSVTSKPMLQVNQLS